MMRKCDSPFLKGVREIFSFKTQLNSVTCNQANTHKIDFKTEEKNEDKTL